jgi:redox-regulated HSP33 family molecular chaperone
MNSGLIKIISENQEAVVYVLDATAVVQESMERLEAWPPATKHLGQAMMAAILIQALADSENQEVVSLQWMCSGPFGHCYAEARNFGEVRGTIHNPKAPVTDYATGLGAGLLQVRRTVNGFSTTSMVNATGDVSNDVVEYLEKSEQKNCGINLSVVIDWEGPEDTGKFKVTSALAYLIHIMPQPTEQKLNDALVRWNRQMLGLGSISKWVLRKDRLSLDMATIITGEPVPNIVMNQRVEFSCNCTVQRAARALALLENQEKKEGSLPDQKETEIRCEFCGKTYILNSSSGEEPGKQGPEKAARKKNPPSPAKKPRKKGGK